ncbi:PRELI/MSF1 domain-containing protein [Macrophomina phaseolina MS6]|uniref:PRELI/MSF1 domain-containing protein n=2 Tax=Macrophomina phaseolina TaxID=35725 RepID=K2S9L6_MACPH|nr:PRELI/MSF1 domain-containing protein [Macrophomina phaseolina MS6]KAH7021767.1 PRELI-like family-domain-containing protein [Macrophomina phaseolina]
MKIFSTTHEFNYSWEEVSINNWRKYCPWNEKTPHVIAVDTLARHVDPATGILRTERLITCKQSAPKWLNSFLGGQEVSHVYETSYVDPKEKKVTMTSVNMTWADLLSVRETVVYKPSSAAPSAKTIFEQNARIIALCGGWQKVKNGIEQFTVERFQQNAARGREGFEMVLEMSRRAFAQEREMRKMQTAKI